MNAHNKYSPVTTTELCERILGQNIHESNMQLLGPTEQKVLFEAPSQITWTNRLGQNNKRGAKTFPLPKPKQPLPLQGGGRSCKGDRSVTPGKLQVPSLQFHFHARLSHSAFHTWLYTITRINFVFRSILQTYVTYANL